VHKQKRRAHYTPAWEKRNRLNVGLGLAETLDAVADFPLAALLEEGHALEALEDIAFNDEAAGALETVVLGHKRRLVQDEFGRWKGADVEFAIIHDKYFSPTFSALTSIHCGVLKG
jgi:hypothetical protein